MKYLLLYFLLVFVIYSCNDDGKKANQTISKVSDSLSQSYLIRGVVPGFESGWVIFAFIDSANDYPSSFDTTKITRSRFEFRGKIQTPTLVWMHCVSSNKRLFGYSFFLDTGVLNIFVNIDSMFNSIATGTKSQDQYNDFRQKYYPLLLESDKAWYEKQRAEKIRDQGKLDSLSKVIFDYDRAIKQIIIENVKQHPASIVSAYLVREHLTAYPDAEILEPLYNGFDSSIKITYYGRQVLKSLQAAKRTMIGLQAPGFSIKDKDGKLISTHSLTGRFTLVDFWASWCGPCRAENPYLLKAFNQFHAKGLNIISVSMDDNRKAWLKAVDEDHLPWTQVCDLKGSKSPVKELYGIHTIPMNYLLNKEGKIIAKNLRGSDLERKLMELTK